MSKSSSNSARQGLRRPEILVAPVITFLAVCGMLVLARNYEALPIQAPSCHFKHLTGLPCLGCGGTRAMMALSAGDLAAALRFNPAIIISVFVVVGWLIWRLVCFFRRTGGSSQEWSRRKVILVLAFFFTVFAGNWIYLLLYLP